MRFKVFVFLIFTVSFGYSQNYDKEYFQSPVHIPIRLAGNYGEIRTNHFHSGIDIKVPFIGLPLYAAADGFISRIRKSAGGYGNALYIDHPNGLRTVYGHMDRFKDDIQKYAIDAEYQQNKFEITIYPDSSKFKVKKGDLIGYAGNSGRSSGPHVHFEIREAENDIPVNPELFKFKITDNVKPKIFYLKLVPLKNNSTVNYSDKKQNFKVYYKNGKYFIPKLINTSGDFGIEINANDYMNYVRNTQGIYSVKMFVDDTIYFSYKIDRISFYKTRYINSFIDYEVRQKTKKDFQKLWKDPGNKLDIYEISKNSGILNFSDNKIHNIKIQLTDCFNNTSNLFLKIRGSKPKSAPKKENNVFCYNKDNYFVKPGFRASIKKGSLYTNTKINFKKIHSDNNLFSDIYQLNSYLIPSQEYIHYAIKPKNLPKKLISKALIVNIDKNGIFYPIGGTYVNEFIAGKCKCFGKFAVTIDTIPPVIELKTAYPNNDFSQKEKIAFLISDNLSGIETYYATIDKKNIIFEYDIKNDKITYQFDSHITYNKLHNLRLVVVDKKNNKSVYNLTFFK